MSQQTNSGVQSGRFLVIELMNGEAIIIDSKANRGLLQDVRLRTSKPQGESMVKRIYGAKEGEQDGESRTSE